MNVRIGHATYTHIVTGKTYKMSFNLLGHETELGKAWDLVSTVARKNGWRAEDVAVKAGVN